MARKEIEANYRVENDVIRSPGKTTKHTPGPWMIERYGSHKDLVIAPGADIETAGIAEVDRRPGDPDGPTPNARLIAAAPEMLEALRSLADAVDVTEIPQWVPALGTAYDAARAAIAKAEGES